MKISAFIALILIGCAEVPECAKFQYSVHHAEGKVYYVLDESNAVRLVQMVESLNKGTCKIKD